MMLGRGCVIMVGDGRVCFLISRRSLYSLLRMHGYGVWWVDADRFIERDIHSAG